MGDEHPLHGQSPASGRADQDDGQHSGSTAGQLDRGAAELDREPAAPAASAASEDLTQQREALRFSALRNAYYHSARLRWFELQHRVLMFAIVLFGTAGVAAMFGKGGSGLLAGLTALLATLDLVLDLRGKAQMHDALKRRYYLLLAKLDEEPDASADKLRRWKARIVKITAEEPVAYRAVDALAANQAIDTLGWRHAKKEFLTDCQYRLRHLSTMQGVTFPLVDQPKTEGDDAPGA